MLSHIEAGTASAPQHQGILSTERFQPPLEQKHGRPVYVHTPQDLVEAIQENSHITKCLWRGNDGNLFTTTQVVHIGSKIVFNPDEVYLSELNGERISEEQKQYFQDATRHMIQSARSLAAKRVLDGWNGSIRTSEKILKKTILKKAKLAAANVKFQASVLSWENARNRMPQGLAIPSAVASEVAFEVETAALNNISLTQKDVEELVVSRLNEITNAPRTVARHTQDKEPEQKSRFRSGALYISNLGSAGVRPSQAMDVKTDSAQVFKTHETFSSSRATRTVLAITALGLGSVACSGIVEFLTPTPPDATLVEMTPTTPPTDIIPTIPPTYALPTPLSGGPPTDTSPTEAPPTPVVVVRENLRDIRIDSVFFPIDPNNPESAAPNVIAQYNAVAAELVVQGYTIVASPDGIRNDTDVFLTGVQDGQGEWTIGGFTNRGILWAASGQEGQETLLYNPADMREGTFDHFIHITDGYDRSVVRRLEVVNGVWTAVVRDGGGNLLAFRNPASGEFWYNLEASTLPNEETLKAIGALPEFDVVPYVDTLVADLESKGYNHDYSYTVNGDGSAILSVRAEPGREMNPGVPRWETHDAATIHPDGTATIRYTDFTSGSGQEATLTVDTERFRWSDDYHDLAVYDETGNPLKVYLPEYGVWQSAEPAVGITEDIGACGRQRHLQHA